MLVVNNINLNNFISPPLAGFPVELRANIPSNLLSNKYILEPITKSSTNDLVKRDSQLVCTGFSNNFNFVLERSSLISSYWINQYIPERTYYNLYVRWFTFTVSSIYSDRYLTYEFQILFRLFNFDLYLVKKLKTKTDEIICKLSREVIHILLN